MSEDQPVGDEARQSALPSGEGVVHERRLQRVVLIIPDDGAGQGIIAQEIGDLPAVCRPHLRVSNVGNFYSPEHRFWKAVRGSCS